MPIHDWTRVSAGTFHDFHAGWIPAIRTALNGGILLPDYYAQAERVTRPFIPDVITLQENDPFPTGGSNGSGNGWHGPPAAATGGVAVKKRRPKLRLRSSFDPTEYLEKQKRVVIRHYSDDRVVAVIEILSPGNKSSDDAFKSFVQKAVDCIRGGYRLSIVDLFPPTPRDPAGVPAAVAAELGGSGLALPADEPLSLSAFDASVFKAGYCEPLAVGQILPDLPVFLEADYCVDVPLEATYVKEFRGLPGKVIRVLEAA